MEKMLSAEETAQALGLCLDSVRRHLRSGKLPGVRVGRNWRVPESRLAAHLGVVLPEAPVNRVDTSQTVWPQKLRIKSGTHAITTAGSPKVQIRPTSARYGSAYNDDENEVVDALLRTGPAREQVLDLVRQAAGSADLAPEDAQRLLGEIGQLLRRL